jgi:hypothetical protein
MTLQTADGACSYRVRRVQGGWWVERAAERLGVFAGPAEAIDHACRFARGDADRGQVAIVSAETAPRELHCYSPVAV